MKSRSLNVMAVFLLLLVVSCASTPRGKYAQLNDAFIGTLQQLINLRQADVISAEDWSDQIYPLILKGDQQLTDWREAIDQGADPFTTEALFQDTLDQLVNYLTGYSQR